MKLRDLILLHEENTVQNILRLLSCKSEKQQQQQQQQKQKFEH